MKKLIAVALTGVCFALGWSGPAAATQLTRAYVSGKGVDSPSCGPLSSPCRQVAYLLTNNMVAPGGEIDIKDPMAFQPFVITQAISVVNDGVGTASVQGAAQGTAITINAGINDAVVLRGLSIDGVGAATTGVLFFTGGSLDIANCVIRRFTQAGVLLSTSNASNFNVSDSQLSGNADGVSVAATGGAMTGVIQRAVANNNTNNGFNLQSVSALKVTIQDSAASNNGANGIFFTAAAAGSQVVVTRSAMNSNTTDGLKLDGFAKVYLSQSTAYGNKKNVDIVQANAAVLTLRNNSLNLESVLGSSTLTADAPQ
jgi:hypothetical protein